MLLISFEYIKSVSNIYHFSESLSKNNKNRSNSYSYSQKIFRIYSEYMKTLYLTFSREIDMNSYKYYLYRNSFVFKAIQFTNH